MRQRPREVEKTLFKKMRRIRSNREAISPVVATLLLIAIAVAAAIVSYSWIMSMIRTQGTAAQTGIRLEMVEFANSTVGSNDWLNVTIRNVGSAATKIETIYVTNSGTTHVVDYSSANLINVGAKREICFESDGFNWANNEAYDIKVVTDNGFTVDGTYYSPAS
jgi:flagellin-like protein